jgi:hypothetical protein
MHVHKGRGITPNASGLLTSAEEKRGPSSSRFTLFEFFLNIIFVSLITILLDRDRLSIFLIWLSTLYCISSMGCVIFSSKAVYSSLRDQCTLF